MKPTIPKLILITLFNGLMLLSCSSMNNLTMNVTEPAPVHLPNHIKRIGILNRSESTTNKTLDKIDEILSAEGLNLDNEGAQNVIQCIKDEFERDQAFENIRFVESDKIENPGLGIFPNALSWETVNTLCKENGVDALVVLSFYDTDAVIKYSAQTIEKINALGLKILVIEHTASVNTHIQAGFISMTT